MLGQNAKSGNGNIKSLLHGEWGHHLHLGLGCPGGRARYELDCATRDFPARMLEELKLPVVSGAGRSWRQQKARETNHSRQSLGLVRGVASVGASRLRTPAANH